MKILLEDSWVEDSRDIIDFAQSNNHELVIMTPKQLKNMSSKSFINHIYFCNTEIVQYHLEHLKCKHLVPDTYDEKFNDHYHRSFKIKTFGNFLAEFNANKHPKFIKPYSNDKLFDGFVFTSIDDFIGVGLELPNNNEQIYVTEPIKILTEMRLLIGNNKLYGKGFISKDKIETHESNSLINKLVDLVGDKYKCIDIGLTIKNNSFVWCIIEINPCFSLDDYDIPFDGYINFCIDSCTYIKNNIN